MDNKTSRLEELVLRYGFSTSSLKWVPEGGELLKYIGQEVAYIDFSKDDQGKWSSVVKVAVIDSISDFEPVTSTYSISYRIIGDECSDDTLCTERIIPEGISYSIIENPGLMKMNRFIPESLHLECVEEEQFYTRLGNLWETRDTLPIEALQTISSSKDRDRTLRYYRNIGATIKTESGEYLYFRISNLKLRPIKGGSELTIVDGDKNTFIFKISKDLKSYSWIEGKEIIGELKLIDLISNK